MKKITAGYYETNIDGRHVEIIKVGEVNAATKNQWFWLINGKGGEDWFNSKKIALEAAKEAIRDSA